MTLDPEIASTLALDGGPKAITVPIPHVRDAAGRSLGAEELAQLREVLDSGTLAYIYGSNVAKLEAAFAKLYEVDQAVACSSGTAALHMALLYLNPEPGDEVLVSPVTDMGSVLPIMAQLAVPVFVDIDPATHNMDPAAIEAAITPRTRAILVPHIYGAPADMDPLMEIARRHGLFVIEDCAQAHLTRYKGRLVGTIGDIGCFSFQQSKHMTTGDGGIVIANRDEQFGRKLRLCMDKGWPRDKGGRDHLFLAPNYHMTELQAAVGIAQLAKLPDMVQARRAAWQSLRRLLAQDPAIRHIDPLPGSVETYFYFPFALDLDQLTTDGAGIVRALQAEGVEVFLGYPGPIPLYRYPVIRDHLTFGTSGWPFTLPGVTVPDYNGRVCPLAEAACRETVLLWWNERLTTAHCDQIAGAIRKVLDHYRK